MSKDHAPASYDGSGDTFKPLVGTDRAAYRYEMDGLEPVTDYDSKTVMLQAGRKDKINIVETVGRFDEDVTIPETVSVVKRTHTYYGPELLVHAELDGTDHNYLLTAPGPDAHLVLWAAETNDRNFREGWYVAAEVQAVLAAEQPPYERCPECGEPMRTIEHEREAAVGACTRAES